MTKRSPIAVFILPMITCGIYAIVWYVKTKEEMNAQGTAIPTAWLLILPFINIYWLWKYCEGVEKVTNKAMTGPVAFLLILLLGSIGMAVVQSKFNSI
ncbi:MAG TPA: hypothetical protein DCZ94_02610 [Lentisphaeria bacterium]|nr:MAG: hypothetical protein A2X48_08240 [Lentisphaerae bacterium GWF2_49_21]HBC85827.1 hypothetical protein [Lentisphaeria bacterium]